MKVFLTGGTGYLGSALLSGLLASGHQVTALCRSPRPDPEDGRLHWVVGSLEADDPSDELLHQHRAVVHAAALVKTWRRDRREFDRINVEAHDRLLERCHRVGVPKVLVTSSFLSLGPSPTAAPLDESARAPRQQFLTDYERTKYLADQRTELWAERGLAVSTVVPTVLFGPGATTDGNLVGRMSYLIRTGRFPGVIGSGEQCWNYAYLPDTWCTATCKALERALPGERYILSGENRTLAEVTRRIRCLLESE
ncbi:MAG: NAD-dependent epimerase/dehydratase family protein [Candidatus Eisenbacteria bacterium]